MENITSRVKRAFIRHLGRLRANLRGGSVCVQGKVTGSVPGWVALKEKRPHCALLGLEMLSISASSSKDKNDEEGASGRGWGSLGGNSSGKEGVISPQPEDKEPQTVRLLPRKSGDEFWSDLQTSTFSVSFLPAGMREEAESQPQQSRVSWPGYKGQMDWTAVFSMLGLVSYGSGSSWMVGSTAKPL